MWCVAPEFTLSFDTEKGENQGPDGVFLTIAGRK